MLDQHSHYEIEFDVPSRYRQTFEEWLSNEAVGWLNHDRIATFDVFKNDTGLSPEVKFVFGFESLKDWAAFVNSDAHEAAMEGFETFADNREAVLWQRASVKLDETPEPPVGDGGRTGVSDRESNTQIGVTQ